MKFVSASGNDEQNPDSFSSPCLRPGFQTTFTYNNIQYTIKYGSYQQCCMRLILFLVDLIWLFSSCVFSGVAPAQGTSRFEACITSARKFLPKYDVQRVSEVNQVPFSTISYYYDRAADVGLIGKQLLKLICLCGGVVTLLSFILWFSECYTFNFRLEFSWFLCGVSQYFVRWF